MQKYILILLTVLMTSSVLHAQCTISSTSDYTVTVYITPKKIIVPTSCTWGYNFEMQIDYTIAVTGTIPGGNLYTMQAEIYTFNNQKMNGFYNMKKTAGSGTITSTTNPSIPHNGTANGYNSPFVNCASASLSNFPISKIVLTIKGPGIPSQTIICPSTSSPLPIELLSFSGEEVNNEVELNWSTAAERENDYFTIERSQDAEKFEVIGTVEGSGTSSVTMDYRFVDNQAPAGVNYYRLTQTDYNGTSETFDIIAVMKNGATEISSTVFPNPTHDGKITLKVNADKTSDLVYSVYSIEGKHIASESIYEHVTEIILPTHQGNYFITVQKGNEVIGRHKVSVY